MSAKYKLTVHFKFSFFHLFSKRPRVAVFDSVEDFSFGDTIVEVKFAADGSCYYYPISAIERVKAEAI